MPFNNGNSVKKVNGVHVLNEASIICIPFNKGQRKTGVEKGPSVLIKNGIQESVQSGGVNVEKTITVDVSKTDGFSGIEACAIACEEIANVVEKEANEGRFCINLGGDHSIATGTIEGLLRVYPDLCVIWVDAHPDINTAAESHSGNVHGMPLSFLIDDPDEATIKAVPNEYKWCRNHLLEPSRLAYIGLRDVDKPEEKRLFRLSITSMDMMSIEKMGIVQAVSSAIDRISHGLNRPIHVSFDIDSMDPSLTPCTGTPVDGGLTVREALCIGEMVNRTGRLVGLDIVEFNPDLVTRPGDLELTVKKILDVVQAFCGKLRPTFN